MRDDDLAAALDARADATVGDNSLDRRAAERIRELQAERDKWIGRAFGLYQHVPDDTLVRDIQDSVDEYETLREQLRVAREALEFYAAGGSYMDDVAPDPAGSRVPNTAPVLCDEGHKAREALEQIGGGGEAPPQALTFEHFRAANVARCEKWHSEGINSWSLADWGVALAGEAGELCDVIKKLNRCRDGLAGNKLSEDELRAELPKEIADTLLYLDLLAAAAGIDLAQAVAEKFNEVSERNGFDERLSTGGREDG